MFTFFPANIVTSGWQEYKGKKSTTVHSSSWCSKKYCFRCLLTKTYFALNILYTKMQEKYPITVLHPSIEFSRYSFLCLGWGLPFFYHFFCSWNKMVIMMENARWNLVFSCLLFNIGWHMWFSLRETTFWNREDRHSTTFCRTNTCR